MPVWIVALADNIEVHFGIGEMIEIPFGNGPVTAAINVDDLRCEYLRDPLGIDTVQPRLSWIVTSDKRGEKQTAYQILVASSEKMLGEDHGDVWDSGKVVSDETIQINYEGRPLSSREQCFWKVRAWDRNGQPGDWSRPARWEMGLLKPED